MAANTKDRWLTEVEVNSACEAIIARGERVTTNAVYDELGQRGSFKTIQKHIKTWEAENSDQLDEIKNLPITAEIPESIEETGKKLLKTFWNEAKTKADAELDVQREALQQAEIITNHKVDEITVFSDKQTETITILREQLAELQTQLTKEQNNTSKLNELMAKEHDKLSAVEKERDLSKQAVENTQEQLDKTGSEYQKSKDTLNADIKALRGDIEKLNKSHEKESKTTQEQSLVEIKGLTEALGKAKAHVESSELKITEFKLVDKENKSLSKQVQTLEIKFDASAKTVDELKEEIKLIRDSEKEANRRADMLEGQVNELRK